MSTVRTLLRATAVVVGSSAALLIGGLMGTAHADPAPVPTPNIGEQLVNSAANAPQLLQGLLGGQPATPPPLASAAIKVPQPSGAGLPAAGSALPGVSSLIPGSTTAAPAATSAPGLGIPGLTPTAPAATSPGLGIPGLTPTVPAAAAPATGPAGLLPQAQLNLPQMPFLPLPLPQQVSLPGDLTSLISGGAPVSTPSVPVSAPAPVTSPNPLLFPVSALP
ncbi:hypothetical protein [Mycobacterium sp.]|uniref:hypothetical protein n=1 Tax=Mycobacterium sp. TaxID=1785 RepID=UPI003F97B0BD